MMATDMSSFGQTICTCAKEELQQSVKPAPPAGETEAGRDEGDQEDCEEEDQVEDDAVEVD